jgi:hypothetical protein
MGRLKVGLIAPDFILRNQEFTYLETEEQKLVFFCDQRCSRLSSNEVIAPAIPATATLPRNGASSHSRLK